MKFIISGGTGFIGSYLLRALSSSPHQIVLLTRSPSRIQQINNATVRHVSWNPYEPGAWMEEINDADVVINLVGKNVVEQRWNEKAKQEIYDSRVIPTKLIVDAIQQARSKPSLLISASAVGYYGDRDNEVITEESFGGNDYLAYVVREWEGAAYRAEQYGVRVATPRTGLVLAKNGGMIAKMLLPFRMFVGGPIGNGKQFLPWIHINDVVRGFLYPVENINFRGVYNLVSPNPVTMKEFARTFGNVLRRPSWAPVPSFVLTALFGEGGKVILSGQRAVPKKLLSAGYQFLFSDLKTALQNIAQ
ncbi:MAG: TIGR01777 family protein [Ignavibacteriales bacterium]|nr:TIGR01777 family protein [Ignavibacteriales bacterium]